MGLQAAWKIWHAQEICVTSAKGEADLESVYGSLHSCTHTCICMLRLREHLGYALQQAAGLHCSISVQLWNQSFEQPADSYRDNCAHSDDQQPVSIKALQRSANIEWDQVPTGRLVEVACV